MTGIRRAWPVLSLALALAAAATPAAAESLHLAVPLVVQRPERCGPAALAMVLRFHGAGTAAVAAADSAYDPILRGALITDLAARARQAGFPAEVRTLTADSLVALLRAGLPPILLCARGVGPLTRGHYLVVTGWDDRRGRFHVQDGGPRERTLGREALLRQWRGGDFRALVVRPGA